MKYRMYRYLNFEHTSPEDTLSRRRQLVWESGRNATGQLHLTVAHNGCPLFHSSNEEFGVRCAIVFVINTVSLSLSSSSSIATMV